MEERKKLSLIKKILMGTIAGSGFALSFIKSHPNINADYSLIPMDVGLLAAVPLLIKQIYNSYN